MKTKEEIISKFIDFNNGCQEIFDLSFKNKLKDSGYKISAKIGQPVQIELRGPDDESIKAFCNDLRKFIQRNDTLEINKLIPFYKSDLIIVQERDIFNKEISDVDNFLKKGTSHSINEKELINKEILDIFLYGSFSHRTEKTKKSYDELRSLGIYPLLKNEFISNRKKDS